MRSTFAGLLASVSLGDAGEVAPQLVGVHAEAGGVGADQQHELLDAARRRRGGRGRRVGVATVVVVGVAAIGDRADGWCDGDWCARSSVAPPAAAGGSVSRPERHGDDHDDGGRDAARATTIRAGAAATTADRHRPPSAPRSGAA